MTEQYDAIVVGGGPSGATAANDLALAGHKVMLLDKAGRIKPCGGAVPPRMLKDFDVPIELLCTTANSARMISPNIRKVDMPVGEGGFVGMVDRDVFDEWLRVRASQNGATRIDGTFEALERDSDGTAIIAYRPKGSPRGSEPVRVRAKVVVGCDGGNSGVARATLPESDKPNFVAAYHEVIESPPEGFNGFEGNRCDVFYQGKHSPDFYAWVFPHGDKTSVGVGSAVKGFELRKAVANLREELGMTEFKTVRVEGAPIPLKPRKRWDNGKDVVVAGDAAGTVAPASGEGIYYAMYGGRAAAEAAGEFLRTGDPKALKIARARFMKAHGQVFWVLGMMQWFWYRSDNMRERFVKLCMDKDIQQLTWEAYMNKELAKKKPMAHVKIFIKDTGQLILAAGNAVRNLGKQKAA
ncbi:geranylgeranyl diphosphate reductase [Polymorphobacter multimanifer]|uniref:geranylgeranyl diphosphate reductase n=1 Tax=Polymorphobacter multimanifer TaxID=1070431 RepID=UPI00166BA741|nr:geranylgeranyl diphosphate reductase [Polymorphobacter multimanifer]GGI76634.1 geranylgeranyl diphosphate reductase [Polymorphobacter multimanifer]